MIGPGRVVIRGRRRRRTSPLNRQWKQRPQRQRGHRKNTSEWTWNVGEDVIANGTLDVVVVEFLRHEAWKLPIEFAAPQTPGAGGPQCGGTGGAGRATPPAACSSYRPSRADWRPFDDAICPVQQSSNLQRQCIAIRSPSLPPTLTEGLAGSFNHGSLWFICFETDAVARRAGDHPRRQLAAGTTKQDVVFLLCQHS